MRNSPVFKLGRIPSKVFYVGAAIVITLFSVYYYHSKIDLLRLTIYQERDVLRARDIFTGGKGIFYGSDTSGGAILPGPSFYFLISVFAPVTDYLRSSYFVLVGLQALFSSLLLVFLFRGYGLVAAVFAASGMFLTSYPTNQFLMFFNPSYLPLFFLSAVVALEYLVKQEQIHRNAAFILGLACSIGLQIHGQFLYVILGGLLVLLLYRKLQLRLLSWVVFGFLAPFAVTLLFYVLTGREILYPFEIMASNGGLSFFASKFTSVDYRNIRFYRVLDFFSWTAPVVLFFMVYRRKELFKKSNTLFVIALMIAIVSSFGCITYLLTGRVGRYGQTAHFAYLLLFATALGISFRAQKVNTKIMVALALVLVSIPFYIFRPQYLRESLNFAEVSAKSAFAAYSKARELTGTDGRELLERLYTLNVTPELFAFKAFAMYHPFTGEKHTRRSWNFFVYTSRFDGVPIDETWVHTSLSQYLPDTISTAIDRGQILVYAPIAIEDDLWLIPFEPAQGSPYISGFSNHNFGYFSAVDESQQIFENLGKNPVKILSNDALKKEVRLRWELCQYFEKVYCRVQQKLTFLEDKKGAYMIWSIRGPSISNNLFKPHYSLVVKGPEITYVCNGKNERIVPIDVLGPDKSYDEEFKKNISVPFAMRLPVRCSVKDITSAKVSFTYHFLNESKEESTALEASF